MIFFPKKLPENYVFNFPQKFEEIHIKTQDSVLLDGLLFTTEKPKGLIFYLHGNGSSLAGWGQIAPLYTRMGYDIFILDYRGYGKSEGKINSQKQLFSDIQLTYDQLKKRYREKDIIIMGYSIGTGPATKLASTNHPKLLVLHAPYYSLTDIMTKYYPVAPTFILKYKLKTYEYLQECKVPVIVFHGDADEVIYYGSSLKLKEHFKPGDTLITLADERHNGITDNTEYLENLKRILNN